jgi:hypothetical protein
MTKCYDREQALDQFSDGELKAEVGRREKIRTAPPEPLPDEEINWNIVKSGAAEYIELVDEKKSLSNSEHFIFESVIVAVYGRDVWEWINKRLG